MSDLKIVDRGHSRLAIAGDIDLASAPELARELAQRGPDLELDLQECTFLDSSGLAVLFEARSTVVPGLAIVNASEIVRRVLTLCGLEELLLRDSDSAAAG